MASFRWGAGGQIVGALGATVFQRGRYGGVARNRSVPVNPNTPRQVRARAAMSWCSDQWLQMSDAQRQAWNDYAAILAWLNRFGDTVNLPGKQHFLRRATLQYSVQAILGLPINIDLSAPSGPGIPPTPTAVIVADNSAGSIEIASMNITPAAGDTVVFEWVYNVSPLRNYYKGPFKFTSVSVGVITFPLVLAATVPDINIGFQTLAKIRWIDSAGRTSNADISRVVQVA